MLVVLGALALAGCDRELDWSETGAIAIACDDLTPALCLSGRHPADREVVISRWTTTTCSTRTGEVTTHSELGAPVPDMEPITRLEPVAGCTDAAPRIPLALFARANADIKVLRLSPVLAGPGLREAWTSANARVALGRIYGIDNPTTLELPRVFATADGSPLRIVQYRYAEYTDHMDPQQGGASAVWDGERLHFLEGGYQNARSMYVIRTASARFFGYLAMDGQSCTTLRVLIYDLKPRFVTKVLDLHPTRFRPCVDLPPDRETPAPRRIAKANALLPLL